MKDLGEDPTKFQFREWQSAHPQHFLVGASGFCQAPGEGIWHVLLFAAPNGSAWWATIRNAPPAARTENVVMLAGAPEYEGEWTIPPFRPEGLPDQLAVIAAAEQAWRAYASEEYLARGLNWIGWGLSGTVTLPDAKKIPVSGLDSLAIVSVGTFRYESSAENPTATNASRLRIDAIEGRLHAAEEGQGRWSSVPFFTSYAVERLGGPAPAVGSREAAPDSYKDVALAVAVASSLLGVALFAYFLPLIRWLEPHLLAFVPSYAKLRREALLDHQTRDQLLGRIRADPGVSPPELRRDSSIGWSTLVYHLSVLEKNKLISSIIDGRHKRLFPVDSLDWSRRPALAALRNRNTKRFYELVLEEPGITQRELAGRVGMTHAGGLWHLQRLEHAGLLLRQKRGHKVHYYPSERGATPIGYDAQAAVEVA